MPPGVPEKHSQVVKPAGGLFRFENYMHLKGVGKGFTITSKFPILDTLRTGREVNFLFFFFKGLFTYF